MGHRKQRRRALTAQLVEGQDDDLIAWLDRLPAGTRQQTVKNALRFALDLPIPAPPPAPELAAVYDELAALRASFQPGNGNRDSAERLAYLESWMQQMAGAYNGLVQRVDALGHLPAAALQSPDPAEAAPQMNADEQAQRARKLKKANW